VFLCVLHRIPRASSFISRFLCFFGVSYFLLFVLSCKYQCKWLPEKTRLRNDLLCVGCRGGRKTTHSLCLYIENILIYSADHATNLLNKLANCSVMF